MSWLLTLDDSFAHADTAVGTAGSTTGVPTTPAVGAAGGWVDQDGGVGHVAGNQLALAANGTTGGFITANIHAVYRSDVAGNPDQRLVVDLPGGMGNNVDFFMMLRRVDSSRYYLFEFYNAGHQVFIYKSTGAGAPTQIGVLVAIGATLSGYSLDLSAVGASPTTITATCTEVGGGGAVTTTTFTDATSALQASGLGYALAEYGDAVAPSPVARVRAYRLDTGPPPPPPPPPPPVARKGGPGPRARRLLGRPRLDFPMPAKATRPVTRKTPDPGATDA